MNPKLEQQPPDWQNQLKEYAELIVRLGVNVQPGQQVLLDAPLEAADLVREIARAAYACGSKDVFVRWMDEQLVRIKYDMAPLEAFRETHAWMANGYEEMGRNGAALISLYAPNPDLLAGADQAKIRAATQASAPVWEPFRHLTHSNRMAWVMASAPTAAWAAKVLPDLPTPEARVAALWQHIFDTVRIGGGEPAYPRWQAHIRSLHDRAERLNALRFSKLHYRAPGTDLHVALPEAHLWVAAGSRTPNGVAFVPNLPTEEVFTAPDRNGVDGTVSSTMPLNYKGQLIEDFQLTFREGRIVAAQARAGQAALDALDETDEGSHYLGEAALVPIDSPIHRKGLLFYNTLFDENASCHLAIGKALPFCLKGGTEMTGEALQAAGANNSLTHVDFMMGSEAMDIDGIAADGTAVPVFRQGSWAF